MSLKEKKTEASNNYVIYDLIEKIKPTIKILSNFLYNNDLFNLVQPGKKIHPCQYQSHTPKEISAIYVSITLSCPK